MRLDKYLKVSRLIKRRTVANEACDAGRIQVNGKVAKASVQVKPGDVIMNMNYFIIHYRFPHPLITRYKTSPVLHIYLIRKGARMIFHHSRAFSVLF